MGEKAFINGSLRTPTGELTEYRPSDPDQRRMLRDCFHVDEAEITNHNGKTIGSIAIYITDKAIQGELRSIIIHTLTNSFAITLLLILALSITLRRLIVDPLTQVAQGIAHCDKDGIPLAALPEQGPIEIRRLSHSVNRMISAIKSSRTALRQQRQQLKEQRDRFQLAVEGTRDGLWDWDLATDHVYHSPRFETMLGYEVGELPNDIRCWSELLHPDDKEQAMKNVEQHLQKRGDEIYESTFRMRTKSGEWRWITGRGKALFSTSGEPIRFVGFNSDVTERIEHQKALEYSAKHDELTGLPNRFLFGELIQNAMHRCQRSNRLLAILYIDLDGFKTVNDTHGHDAGDEVLRESARRMQETLRQEDVVARIGGDEFVIAIADLNQRQEVDGLVRRLLRRLGEPTLHRGRDHIVHSLKVSASIGITFYPQQNDIGADALLRQADQAMYTAKESGKNRYDIFNPAQHQRITA
jgi:diguanylate cyclase (GGDEF)-like protein/PAS domain S-box-containing protein